LSTVRFETGSEKNYDRGYVEYKLYPAYAGKSLLDIVKICMPGSSTAAGRINTGSSTWKNGKCPSVGRIDQAGRMNPSAATKLRIGVGNGHAHRFNWALFMILDGEWGNGKGDFFGSQTYAFGSYAFTNTGNPMRGSGKKGMPGEVRIYGTPYDSNIVLPK